MSIFKEFQILTHFRFGDLQIKGCSVYVIKSVIISFIASEGALSSERIRQVIFPLEHELAGTDLSTVMF